MDYIAEVTRLLRRRLDGALAGLVAGPVEYTLEVPRDRNFGDFATNAALVLAGRLARPPREVAETLARILAAEPPAGHPVDGRGAGADDPAAAEAVRQAAEAVRQAAVQVAGPGFVNFRMPAGWLTPVVERILVNGEAYGCAREGPGTRIQVEFVSANPTGPLNVVNARAAAYGDALANVLAAAGYRVQKEYYVNDAGTQFEMLGLAMAVRCRQALGEAAELPEGAYPGEYVAGLAREYLAAKGETTPPAELDAARDDLARFAVEKIVAGQREVLARYGVVYDAWVRESEVRAAGGPERVLGLLRERGHVYDQDGAVWFRSTTFGDDQDRVLVRQNGEYTYFLADVAYHLGKFERGFERVIDIWGQDHHGYVPRMRAAVEALGYGGGSLEVLLTQLVRLVRGGEVVKMSKRRGEFITMDEFLEDVGRDAARFMFLMRSLDSHMDFDIDLARLEAAENPVYYVQYAHARICSILRQAGEAGAGAVPPGTDAAEVSLLTEPAETELLRCMAGFPGEVALAAADRAPHRLTVHARELATTFHGFYTQCRVLGDDPKLTQARLALVAAARQVLANTLALLGVSAPERM